MDDKLRKFVTLVESGTYTKAAHELHVSQPALSVAIQRLEAELGSQLLLRTGKRLELTAAGKAVYEAAQSHQDIQRELQGTLHAIRRKRPSIAIGMIDSVAEYICTTTAFRELESSADVTLIVNNSRHLRSEVEKRSLPCALIIDDEIEHTGTTSTVFIQEELLLIAHAKAQDIYQIQVVQGLLHDFISYDRSSTTRRHIKRQLAEQSINTRTKLYSTSPSVMLRMVLDQNGCAVLPRTTCEPFIASGELAVLTQPIYRPISLIQGGEELPAIVDEFLGKVQDSLSLQC